MELFPSLTLYYKSDLIYQFFLGSFIYTINHQVLIKNLLCTRLSDAMKRKETEYTILGVREFIIRRRLVMNKHKTIKF